MRAFRLLGLRRLRQSPLRAAIASVAVAAGVTLAVAILVTTASIQRSVEDFGRTLAGPAELRLIGATPRAGLSDSAVAAAAAVDGVDAVIPMVQLVGRLDVVGDAVGGGLPFQKAHLNVLILGVDCRVEALLGDFGCDQALIDQAGDVALVRGRHPAPGSFGGGHQRLRTDIGWIDLDQAPVSGALDAINEGYVVVLPLAVAQRHFQQEGFVDVAYVQRSPGADAGEVRAGLAAAIGPQNDVLRRDDPPAETEVVLRAFVPLFSLLGLFGLGTGAVLVRNTVALSLEERRRQLAITAAVGGDGRTLIGGAVAEATLLGLIGGLAGVVGGVLVGGVIVDGLSSFTRDVAGVVLTRHVPSSAVVIGAVLGAAVAALAALGPAIRASRLDVAAELSGRAISTEAKPVRLLRRWLLWSGIGLAGVAVCWLSQRDGGIERWQAAVGPIGFLAATVAMLLAAAAAAPLLIGLVARRFGGTPRPAWLLALAELGRDPRRVGVMAVAIVSPITTGFATDGFISSAETSIRQSFEEGGPGVSVSTEDANDGGDVFITPEARTALAALPGVASLESGTFVSAGHDAADLLGVETATDVDVTDWDFLRGSPDPAAFAAGEALIGPSLARREGARPGDRITLPTPGGMRDVVVQGIVDSGDANGYIVVLHPDRFRDLFGDRPPAYLVLRPADGVSEAQLAATVQATGRATIDPGLQAQTTDELTADIVEAVGERMLPFRVMQQALLLVAFVAVLSTLLLAGLQRRREHGLLAAVGADPGALRRVVVLEALVVALGAVAVALVGSPVILWAMLQVIPLLIGEHNPFSPDWASFAFNAGLAVVVVLVAAAWPAWRSGRVEVLDALRYE